MPRGKAMRRPNGSGTIVKLSGKRRKPYEVRVNTHINEWGYPAYDVLGRFENRLDADIALAEFNRSSFDVKKLCHVLSENQTSVTVAYLARVILGDQNNYDNRKNNSEHQKRYELNKREPRQEQLRKIANALDVSSALICTMTI